MRTPKPALQMVPQDQPSSNSCTSSPPSEIRDTEASAATHAAVTYFSAKILPWKDAGGCSVIAVWSGTRNWRKGEGGRSGPPPESLAITSGRHKVATRLQNRGICGQRQNAHNEMRPQATKRVWLPAPIGRALALLPSLFGESLV